MIDHYTSEVVQYNFPQQLVVISSRNRLHRNKI